ncbi:MAG: LuxR C-terminal-related transcriptional regulator [Synergistaceae bacterium]|jgi:LuxR family maltose regulon positive regulatory protein|nr:LuxR C-terminal-related transcriptional regulator [Synergistaceae bacterium]
MQDHFFHNGVPAVSENEYHLERPRIDELLEKAVRNPVVSVVAGAGYGKTEAVYSFLKKYDSVTTWVQLSRKDNVRSRFWENYTHAVYLSNPDYAATLMENGFPETDSEFDRYPSAPWSNFSKNTKYVTVFDDFHLIEDPAVLHFIERSIHLPFLNGVTTIIISRHELPIDMIDLFSKGLMTHISEDDLRFSGEEIRDYLQSQGVKASRETLAAICDSTEGWVFAVKLTGLILKKTPHHANSALFAMKQNVFRLIESEIFSGMSKKLQKFLVLLSLTDHLSLDFVKELSPNEDLMAELGRVSTFIRYDAYLNVYRIHHLFLNYLAQKQNMLTEEEKRDVYLRAIQWCVDNDYKIDAISYCEKAKDFDKLIEVVYTLQMMLPNNTALFLLEVCKRISPEDYERHPTLYLIYTRLLASLGRFDEAIPELQALIKKYEALPQTSVTCRILFGLCNNLAFSYYFRCMYKHEYEFWQYFKKSGDYYAKSSYVVQGPIRNLGLGTYACRIGSPKKGEIERFVEAVEASIPHVSVTMGGNMYGLDDLTRAEAAFFRADMKHCEKFARQTLFKAREKEQYEIENRALFFLLRVSLAAGNYAELRNLRTQLEAQLDKKAYINRYTLYDIVTGWYYVSIRQTDQIAPWLKNNFEESDINSLMHGFENLVKAKYYLGEKKYHILLAFIEGQRDRDYGPGAFLFGKIELKILEAISLYHLKETEKARVALEEAYDIACPNDLNMPFIEQGNDMRTLTRVAMKDERCKIPAPWLEKIYKKSASYAKKVTSIIAEYRKAHGLDKEIRLSSRELMILNDLCQGLSRSEMAASQDLSINTINAALQMIYAKLGAENASDAVRIATSLNLVDS